MISRRIIRIKVLQVLYAYYTSPDKSINNTEKELFFSIQKTYDLYHYILQLPVEIANHANSLIELRKKKHFPTEEDLNPNRRFINNSIVRQLNSNQSLNKYLAQSKLGWSEEPELIKKLYNALVETDFYADYMSSEQHTYADDKKLIELLFGEVILQSEDLINSLEEQSIYWNDDLDFVVSMIIKTVKKFKEYAGDEQSLLPFFKDEEDREFAKNLFRKCILNHLDLKKIVEQHTVNWDIERIAFIDNMILELAIVEFLYFPSIPTKVTLNEYIELSKYYSTQKSRNFINGILDKSLKALKKEDKVVKTGRGLIGEDNSDE
ncbi:MAG: transcription antitermination factor NusB [Prolixibacteraceae bacterium]